MTDPARPVRPFEGPDDGPLGALARKTRTPIELVKVLYDQEMAELQTHSLVKNFISVIAGRRVKERLLASVFGSRTRGSGSRRG